MKKEETHMRTWLFYRTFELGKKIELEFRRADYQGVHEFVPEHLRGIIEVPRGADVAKFVERLVIESGWVGDAAQSAECEIGTLVLKGNW